MGFVSLSPTCTCPERAPNNPENRATIHFFYSLGRLPPFASVVAQTATDGSEVIYSDKSFALLSEDYMNFNIRLGYHLSTIEVFGGCNENENFIKFIFKGGGATIERRDRRTRVITRAISFSAKIWATSRGLGVVIGS